LIASMSRAALGAGSDFSTPLAAGAAAAAAAGGAWVATSARTRTTRVRDAATWRVPAERTWVREESCIMVALLLDRNARGDWGGSTQIAVLNNIMLMYEYNSIVCNWGCAVLFGVECAARE
jgi:hypothetical protein